MSICGTGMGNGALLMQALGHEVIGVDQNTYPPMSDRLADAGIKIYEGYDATRLENLNVDLVVVGNVNTRGNEEVEWLLSKRQVPFTSLPALLADHLLSKRLSIVVSGTHGKTTTTTLAAYILRENGANPGYLIGGVPHDFSSGAAIGDKAAPFVIEGDEYDSAFFDKRSKFIHYCPRILLINNLEFDHADIFRDLEDIKRSFSHLLKLVPEDGCIIANSDDVTVEQLLNLSWAPILRVGVGDRSDLQIVDFKEDEKGSSFKLYLKGTLWAEISWPVWGLFNARNLAMAALAAGMAVNPENPSQLKLESLGQFQGVKRRQEILYQTDDITVISDFAHHPTAVGATLESLKRRFPESKLILCHEARSNTACRNIHEADYALAFDHADSVYLGAVYRSDRYADSERIDMAGIADRLGDKAKAFATNEELLSSLKHDREYWKHPVVLLFCSNGSFDGVHHDFSDYLSRQ